MRIVGVVVQLCQSITNSICTRTDGPQYFNDEISRVSCSTWDVMDASASLKAGNIPPWREDWEEFIDLGIDVFKMHGRESMVRLMESMDIISRWEKGEDLLFSQFDPYMEDLGLKERPIDLWRDKIKTVSLIAGNVTIVSLL